MKTALYAGSFDPLTNGHIDVIQKALKVFDRIILLVANNDLKKTTFTLDERKAILEENFKNDERIIIDATAGLTVRKAKELGVDAMIRGLRDVQDFGGEQRLYITNKALDEEIETFYIMASPDEISVSSHNLKVMLKAGEDISKYAPKASVKALIKAKDRI